jgi:hypothetical protein
VPTTRPRRSFSQSFSARCGSSPFYSGKPTSIRYVPKSFGLLRRYEPSFLFRYYWRRLVSMHCPSIQKASGSIPTIDTNTKKNNRIVKSRRMRSVEETAHVGDIRNACNILVRNLRRRDHLEDLGDKLRVAMEPDLLSSHTLCFITILSNRRPKLYSRIFI